jgi:hypothetical protein
VDLTTICYEYIDAVAIDLAEYQILNASGEESHPVLSLAGPRALLLAAMI